MSTTELMIVNMALAKLGVGKITQADWTTPITQQAIDAAAIFEIVRDIVLEAKNWKFAKTRTRLEQRYESPEYSYDYAYALPIDFLRLSKRGQNDQTDPSVYPYFSGPKYSIETVPLPSALEKLKNGSFTGASTFWTLGAGWTYGTNQVAKAIGNVNTLSQVVGDMVSVPVVGELYQLQTEIVAITGGSLIPSVGGVEGSPIATIGVKTQKFIVESVASGVIFTPSATDLAVTIDNVSLLKLVDRLCLLTDYDDTDASLYINYIRRIKDCSRYPGTFVNALACRLAAELSVTRKSSRDDKNDLMNDYGIALVQAEELNQASDYVENETGDDSWETAGR